MQGCDPTWVHQAIADGTGVLALLIIVVGVVVIAVKAQ
jgi:hypothetical protein